MSTLRRHYIMANKGEDNYSYIDLSPNKPVLKLGQYAVSYKAPDINLFCLTEAPVKSAKWYNVRTEQTTRFVFVKNWFYNGEGMWIFEGELPELIGGMYLSTDTFSLIGSFTTCIYQYKDSDSGSILNPCTITEITFPDGSGPSSWYVLLALAPCVDSVLDNINFSSGILDVEGLPTVINMKIPNTVISIIPTPNGPAGGFGSDLFANNFTTLEVAEDNPIYDSRDNCNAVIETATNRLVMSSKNTFIPNSVTALAPGSFWDCDIETLTIPNNIISVADYAFANSNLKSVVWDVTTHSDFTYCNDPMCALFPSSLELIEFGPNVKVIPDNLCRGTSIKEVYIPSTVDSVGKNAFSPYWSSTITLLDSATIDSKIIGLNAFENCYFLKSLTIGNNVTSIGKYAFSGCSSLTSITIPNSVTSIGERAFSWCDALTSMIVENGNTIYDSRENCNAIIETATNTLIAGCGNTTIPNSVTRIGDFAFSNCSSLTTITIPNSVTSIGVEAFYWCDKLTSVTIPNSVTSIGWGAFQGYKSNLLVTLTAPSVEAFCNGLGNRLLNNAGCSAARKIAINGEIVTSIVIPNSVTGIGNWAFYNCYFLTSVAIPESVTWMGNYAFQGCSALTSITFNGTMEEWNNITKGSTEWNDNVPATYVQCSDGSVQL